MGELEMSVLVSDIIRLQPQYPYEIVAGEGGLSRPVSSAGILDYEYAPNVRAREEDCFNRDSIAISSLLFARDDEALLHTAIRDLIEHGVSALIYKPVVYQTLPESVLALADREQFPILMVDGPVYFESIIYSILEIIKRADVLRLVEQDLTRLADDDPKGAELQEITARLNPSFSPFLRAAYLKRGENTQRFDVERFLGSSVKIAGARAGITIGGLKDGIMVLMSANGEEESYYDAMLQNVLAAEERIEGRFFLGLSEVHELDGIGAAVREALYSAAVALWEGRESVRYQELGTYRFLIPLRNSPSLKRYMQDYLGPVLSPAREDAVPFLRTAVVYILKGGNVSQVAEALFCHKNTVRYRINRLKEMIDPTANELEFYERLSAAVKIYLLLNQF